MKKLLILSGKGGTGKTTTTAAFIHFAQAKAFADCDVDAPNLHLLANLNETPVQDDFYGSHKATIDPALCNGCGICATHCRFDSIQKQGNVFACSEYACEGCGVCSHVCPQHAISMVPDVAGKKTLYKGHAIFSTAELKMGRGNSGKLVTDVKKALTDNATDTELAIIDGSPGIGCPVIASINGVDWVLVVAEPSLSGISDLKRLVKTAQSLQAKLAVCVNMWDTSPQNTDAIQQFCQDNSLPFVGKIPYDSSVVRTVNHGVSIATLDTPAKHALQHVFENTIALLKD